MVQVKVDGSRAGAELGVTIGGWILEGRYC